MLMINNGNDKNSYDDIVTTNDSIDNGYDKKSEQQSYNINNYHKRNKTMTYII